MDHGTEAEREMVPTEVGIGIVSGIGIVNGSATVRGGGIEMQPTAGTTGSAGAMTHETGIGEVILSGTETGFAMVPGKGIALVMTRAIGTEVGTTGTGPGEEIATRSIWVETGPVRWAARTKEGRLMSPFKNTFHLGASLVGADSEGSCISKVPKIFSSRQSLCLGYLYMLWGMPHNHRAVLRIP